MGDGGICRFGSELLPQCQDLTNLIHSLLYHHRGLNTIIVGSDNHCWIVGDELHWWLADRGGRRGIDHTTFLLFLDYIYIQRALREWDVYHADMIVS